MTDSVAKCENLAQFSLEVLALSVIGALSNYSPGAAQAFREHLQAIVRRNAKMMNLGKAQGTEQ